MDAAAHLQRLFGHESFRPGQQEAIEAALAGRDALVVMPTGSGKSLCYQLPGLSLDGLTIVISPLVALMRDQGDALTAAGHGAARVLNASLPPGEAESVLAAIADGTLRARAGGARALRRRPLPRRAGRPRDRALRGRRGALPERVGPRLPPRLPAPGRCPRRHRRALHDGADGDRHAARRRRHRPRAAPARPRRGAHGRRPPQPHVRRGRRAGRARAARAARERAGRPVVAPGDRLRRHARALRGGGGAAERVRCARRGVPRGRSRRRSATRARRASWRPRTA